ncbi:MAG: HAD-IC family P-type ATPase [Candidatus Micrarchaeota archaeon]
MSEKQWHAVPASEALRILNSSEKGLSEKEASERLKRHGPNELQKARKKTPLKLFLEQFKNILIIVMLTAAVVSVLIGEFLDAAAMFAIILLSAVLGFIQDYRAEKAMEALEKIFAPSARVFRDGKEKKVAAKELVPGDVVLLEAGDIVPADARILEHASLQIDEASLTGESVPSAKFTQSLKLETSITDQENMAFAGTAVTYGKGKAVIVATGMSTEFGKIASSIQQEKESKTPLQTKVEEMSKQIGMVVVALITIVFVGGIFLENIEPTEMLLFSLSLAVAAIPSSLPALVTISLAVGAKELARKKMIIRKLPAAESLGAATVICSDKTGTITKNEMTVTRIYLAGRELQVTGSGYVPQGEFLTCEGKKIEPEKLRNLALFLEIGVLCNNAKMSVENGKYTVLGDPTEGALLVLAEKAGLDQTKALEKYSVVRELPFDSDRKIMTVIVKQKKNKTGGELALIKGAPELLLKRCDRILEDGIKRKLTRKDVEKILEANDRFADDALRVLGFAFNDRVPKNPSVENTEKNLVFLGLAGMIDPPREEVCEAVKKTREAGIQVIVITGDHALTTKAVAKKIGLFEEGDLIVTGEEIDGMSDAELARKIDRVRIFARTLPLHKSRIVEALKKKGHVVAMTGDGVNDAPALKKADIGISMGITGTEVAKEVSKAILADDNFATIVNAVSEGRNIYDKIIKSTKYLLSCNAGEIVIVVSALFARMPLPLVPMQILFMNLLTDGLPALGLGFESAEEEAMKRPPRNPSEKPLTKPLMGVMLLFGLIMGLGSFWLFTTYLHEGLEKARTVAFTTLVMFEMFAALGSRSLYPFRKLNPLTNKWLTLGIASSIILQLVLIYWAPLQPIFKTVPLDAYDWLKILVVSSFGFVLMEAGKFLLPVEKRKADEAPAKSSGAAVKSA